MLTIRVSDRDEPLKVNFQGSFNFQRFIDKMAKEVKVARENFKVVFKGRIINNLPDETT